MLSLQDLDLNKKQLFKYFLGKSGYTCFYEQTVFEMEGEASGV